MQTSYSPHEAQVQFLNLLRTLRSQWVILACCLVAGAVVSVLLGRIAPSKFVATARVKSEGERPPPTVFELRREGEDLNYLQNQAEIIQSQPVLYPVIERLNLQSEWAQPGSSLNLSDAFRERVVVRLLRMVGLKKPPEGDPPPLHLRSAFWKLRSQLSVRRVGNSSFIEITVADTRPQRAAAIANLIAATFQEQQLESKRASMSKALDQLRQEIDKQQDRLQQAQQKVERLRRELNVPVFPGNQGRPDDQYVQDLLQELNRARTEMVTLEAKLKEVKKLDVAQMRTAAASISRDGAVEKLSQELAATELQIEVLKQGYGPEHPALKEAIATREKLREQLDARLAGVVQGLEMDLSMVRARVQELEKRLEQAREAVGALDAVAYLPYRNAQREEESERQLFEQLKARLQRETVEIQVARSPIELIDRAEATLVGASSLPAQAVVGAGAGLLLGVALVFLLEFFNTSLKRIEDVEKHLDLPVLGVVPQGVGVLGQGNGDVRHIEVYRMLRANIEFARGPDGGKAVCILSAGAGEGKSLTCANLAVVWAQQGTRLVVVDCDLHRSALHSYLHVPNAVGLVDFLRGERTLDEVIAPTEFPNLCVIASGARPGDGKPLPAFTSAKVRELVRELSGRFDICLFDSPPVLAVSDAAILAREVGQQVFVLQLHRYPRNMHERAVKVLRGLGGQLLGAVVNKVRVSATDMDYYYQSDYATYRGAVEHRLGSMKAGERGRKVAI